MEHFTSNILMISPDKFRNNEHTLSDNMFQSRKFNEDQVKSIALKEFDKLREDIINGNQEFEIDIEEFENLDGDKNENVKIRININGNDIVNIDSEDE